MSSNYDRVKATTCLFCRTPGTDKEEYEKRRKERIETNDPAALSFRGEQCYRAGDYDAAFEYYKKAAELGRVWIAEMIIRDRL